MKVIFKIYFWMLSYIELSSSEESKNTSNPLDSFYLDSLTMSSYLFISSSYHSSLYLSNILKNSAFFSTCFVDFSSSSYFLSLSYIYNNIKWKLYLFLILIDWNNWILIWFLCNLFMVYWIFKFTTILNSTIFTSIHFIFIWNLLVLFSFILLLNFSHSLLPFFHFSP